MVLKVFLATICLLVLAGLGFGIKLIFNNNAKLPAGSCQSAKNSDSFSCGCDGDTC